MLKNAEMAEQRDSLVCQDTGIPFYYTKVGTRVEIDTDIKYAVSRRFEHLLKTKNPPVLGFITNSLSHERGYRGKRIPIVSLDLKHDADYIEMTCVPKGLGSGSLASFRAFGLVPIETIEEHTMECVLMAAGAVCPPIVLGIGIGGSIDQATKLTSEALLRPIGMGNLDPEISIMEEAILKVVNETGSGPMGLGGNTTALAVNIDVSAGHGFIPVAVSFNCWPNRRARARIHDDGKVEYYE